MSYLLQQIEAKLAALKGSNAVALQRAKGVREPLIKGACEAIDTKADEILPLVRTLHKALERAQTAIILMDIAPDMLMHEGLKGHLEAVNKALALSAPEAHDA